MPREKDYLIEELAILLGSGVNAFRALDVIGSESKSSGMKKVISSLRNDLDEGSSLWKALDNLKIFSEEIISLVRLGEETGNLVRNLNIITEKQRRNNLFRSRVLSALMYPSLIVLVGFLAGIFISWFVMPHFVSVFLSFNIELPIFTRALIFVSESLTYYGVWSILVLLIFIFSSFYFTFIFYKTRFIGHFLLSKVPGIGKLFSEIEMARFGYSLGSMLEAGLPINRALESLQNTTISLPHQKVYNHLAKSIEDGNSFKKSFDGSKQARKIIPTFVREMIVTGEQSGNISEIMLKIGDVFESKNEITIKNLTVIIEPLALVIVWLWVVFIVMAVVLPIYSLISTL
ncbi:MAG: putative type II secretion system protein F [candidate division WS2 bacterium]|nr:putative type II secretion system protein F [Candidatus Psychracetigena formicireducens]